MKTNLELARLIDIGLLQRALAALIEANSLREDGQDVAARRRSIAELHEALVPHSQPVKAPEPPVPEGFTLVAVKGLAELVTALARAENKGYLPDAMADEWAAFDYRVL